MKFIDFLLTGFSAFTWQQGLMMIIGGILIYLAIVKEFEPSLLLPIGFGAILVNIPYSGAITQIVGTEHVEGILDWLFNAGIATEAFPLLLFIGIGAMIDFGPLLSNPFMLLFGAAAQFGIFFTLVAAVLLGFDIKDAASIGIIGAADGPTSIFVANQFKSTLLAPITVAAYSYMSLVPVIQPIAIKMVTTKKERAIKMSYKPDSISKRTRILFPIIVTIIAGLFAPVSVSLVGFLMFGNLIRECGVLDRLSETAQTTMVNLITLMLGITIASSMKAETFVNSKTLLVILLGLLAFTMDSIGGVLFAKFINLFRKEKVNPMIGAAGISAFPMSARVIQKMATEEDPSNFILMHAVGANVAGQIASVIAGGLILQLLG